MAGLKDIPLHKFLLMNLMPSHLSADPSVALRKTPATPWQLTVYVLLLLQLVVFVGQGLGI